MTTGLYATSSVLLIFGLISGCIELEGYYRDSLRFLQLLEGWFSYDILSARLE